MRFWTSLVSSLCLPSTSKRLFALHATPTPPTPVSTPTPIPKKVAWNFGPLGHLAVAHATWKDVLRPGDTVIDATCGNGQDSLALAELSLTPTCGSLYCIDIQRDAIDNTRDRLQRALSSAVLQRVQFIHDSHAVFPSEIADESVKLICYNLGYLPGKSRRHSTSAAAPLDITTPTPIITTTASTLQSLSHALRLLCPAGLLSVTAYPGHIGGDEEAQAVETFLSNLNEKDWRVYSHRALNRPTSPILFLVCRIDKNPKNTLTE
jgi:SAM-dependent methyltransferase